MESSYLINAQKPCKQRITIFDNLVDANKKLLTISELSKLIGFSNQTIYNWIHRRSDFPYIKIGKPVRFELQKVIDWLERY